MAYSSASNVALLTQNVLAGASTFSTSSSPTLAAVNYWLSAGCSIIESTLASAGYAMPVPVGVVARDAISMLETKYAASWVETSRINVRLSPNERTRSQVLLEEFYRELDHLSEQDLTRSGVSKEGTAGVLYAGGISIGDKETVEADSDRVVPRFTRGQWRFPNRKQPSKASKNT